MFSRIKFNTINEAKEYLTNERYILMADLKDVFNSSITLKRVDERFKVLKMFYAKKISILEDYIEEDELELSRACPVKKKAISKLIRVLEASIEKDRNYLEIILDRELKEDDEKFLAEGTNLKIKNWDGSYYQDDLECACGTRSSKVKVINSSVKECTFNSLRISGYYNRNKYEDFILATPCFGKSKGTYVFVPIKSLDIKA